MIRSSGDGRVRVLARRFSAEGLAKFAQGRARTRPETEHLRGDDATSAPMSPKPSGRGDPIIGHTIVGHQQRPHPQYLPGAAFAPCEKAISGEHPDNAIAVNPQVGVRIKPQTTLPAAQEVPLMHTTPVMMNLTRRIRRLAPAAAVAALLLAATPVQAEPARASSTQAWSGVQPIPGANSSNGAGLGVTVLNNRVQLVFKGVTGDQRLFSDSYTDG